MTVRLPRARKEKTQHELRCFCRGTPLLAMYGVDPKDGLYVHVKIYKQNRVYGECYYTGGTVKIRCRNCLRWNRVIFVAPASSQPVARLEETVPPPVAMENPPDQSLRSGAPDL